MKPGMTQKQDLTLHFAECPHSERVAEDVMADLYPAFVFLLLPLCHLLRYRRLGSLGEVGELPAWPVQRTGGGEEGGGGGALQSEEPPTAENARTHANYPSKNQARSPTYPARSNQQGVMLSLVAQSNTNPHGLNI